ncbi:MAG: RnfABCDGE type electron transport complex subunit B [Bacilli bacterium]|jgi:electron transport complex protein RnfB|nr:RnfABCDGE type electron transport complex subunit B [Bacilli bacterium]
MYWYILYGVLVLAGLGFLLGVFVTWAAKVFRVEEDPRIAEVEKLLPNANCGACGFPGCHAMAEALVKGEVTKVSSCKAGKKEKNYDPIIAYLGAHPGKDGKTNVPTL